MNMQIVLSVLLLGTIAHARTLQQLEDEFFEDEVKIDAADELSELDEESDQSWCKSTNPGCLRNKGVQQACPIACKGKGLAPTMKPAAQEVDYNVASLYKENKELDEESDQLWCKSTNPGCLWNKVVQQACPIACKGKGLAPTMKPAAQEVDYNVASLYKEKKDDIPTP